MHNDWTIQLNVIHSLPLRIQHDTKTEQTSCSANKCIIFCKNNTKNQRILFANPCRRTSEHIKNANTKTKAWFRLIYQLGTTLLKLVPTQWRRSWKTCNYWLNLWWTITIRGFCERPILSWETDPTRPPIYYAHAWRCGGGRGKN